MRRLLFEDDGDLFRAFSAFFGFNDSSSAQRTERAKYATAVGAFIVVLALIAEVATWQGESAVPDSDDGAESIFEPGSPEQLTRVPQHLTLPESSPAASVARLKGQH